MTSPPSSKLHIPSPSKQSSSSSIISGRTYDAKLVTREMHRLGGTLAHIPAALAPGLAASSATSSSSLTLNTPLSASASVSDSSWAQLTVYVLPMFNGDPLQCPIEDLNILARRHIESVMSRSPSRALNTLELDAIELIKSGMVTLNVKLSGIDDDKLLSRVVEVWGFFWDQVLPYVEGVLLPLQMHPLLLSLHRTPKTHRASSPSHQLPSPDVSNTPVASFPAHGTNISMTPPIDVRTLALCAFRDHVIVPIATRLESRIISLPKRDNSDTAAAGDGSGIKYQQPRLQQMLLVLVSQANRNLFPVTLTERIPPPSHEERITRSLLDALLGTTSKSGLIGQSIPTGNEGRPPSFLSQGAPRDRRGRVGEKSKPKMRVKVKGKSKANDNEGITNPNSNDDKVDADEGALETPRDRYGQGIQTSDQQEYAYDAERERGLDLLESLRSPDIETTVKSSKATRYGDDISNTNKSSERQGDGKVNNQIAIEGTIDSHTNGQLNRRLT